MSYLLPDVSVLCKDKMPSLVGYRPQRRCFNDSSKTLAVGRNNGASNRRLLPLHAFLRREILLFSSAIADDLPDGRTVVNSVLSAYGCDFLHSLCFSRALLLLAPLCSNAQWKGSQQHNHNLRALKHTVHGNLPLGCNRTGTVPEVTEHVRRPRRWRVQ